MMIPWPAVPLQPVKETTLGAARHSSLVRPPSTGVEVEGYRATGGHLCQMILYWQSRPIGNWNKIHVGLSILGKASARQTMLAWLLGTWAFYFGLYPCCLLQTF